jgi:hypothetical protein
MRLSDAIRLGAKIRPQCCSGAYSEHGKSCVFGAAAEALNIDPARLHADSSKAEYEYCFKYNRTIIQDNDSGMTREAIANRLEAIGH